jgi:O-antigen/teichoic acid export membrane protein
VTTGISWKKFHADVLAAMLGRWGALGAGFVTTMLLTRILPVADVGVYFIVLSLVLILGPLANVGLQEPTLRAIASFTATGDHARAAAVAGSALKLGIATAGLLSVLVAVVWVGLCKAGLFLTEQDLLTGAFVACWMAVVAVETQLVGTFQGLEKIRLAVLCDGALSKLLAMVAVAIMFVSRGRATVHEILLIFVLCEAATVAVALFCLGPLISFSPEPALTASASDLLKTARRFLLHQLAALTSSQSDAIVLGLFRPPAQVAQYGTAMRLSSLLSLPASAANVPLAPATAKLQAQRKWAELEKILQISGTGATAIAVLMTIVFTVWGELLLNKFFGPSYGAGAGVLAILCTGQCINLALGQSMVALAMTGEQAVVTRIAVLSGALKIVLSVVLGYLAGAIGVAVASAVATAVAKLIGWSAARRRLNIDTRIRLSLVGLGLKHVYRSLNGYIQTRQM